MRAKTMEKEKTENVFFILAGFKNTMESYIKMIWL
jgi:hypothetical protein